VAIAICIAAGCKKEAPPPPQPAGVQVVAVERVDVPITREWVGSVGAGATGPLFQGGSLHGQYEQAKENWELAKLQYQQAALNAFGDVANALASRSRLSEVRERQERAVHAYSEAVRLSTERYKSGKASYFEVLQAQEALFPAEVSLAQTRRDQFTAIVRLYKALGGGLEHP
jgi:multidrug efflux system outer membrane protein